MELSPNYSGTLMGLTTTFANMAGFVGPLFTGVITNNNVTFYKQIKLSTFPTINKP